MSACINRSEKWKRNRHKRKSHDERTRQRAANREAKRVAAEKEATP